MDNNRFILDCSRFNVRFLHFIIYVEHAGYYYKLFLIVVMSLCSFNIVTHICHC